MSFHNSDEQMRALCELVMLFVCLTITGCDRPETISNDSSAATSNSRSEIDSKQPAAEHSVGQPASNSSNLNPLNELLPPRSGVADQSISDDSLTGDQHLVLGVPAIDRIWLADEMKRAAEVLDRLGADHPRQLPRFESAKSGNVFAKIISTDSFDVFRDKSAPFALRLAAAMAFMESHNIILRRYFAGFEEHRFLHEEAIELVGSQLRNWHVMFDLVDEIWPTLSSDEPSYPDRVKGLKQLQGALAGLVSVRITTLTEHKSYTVPMRLRLLKYCQQEFPHIDPRLADGSQAEVLIRLGKLIDAPQMQPMQDQMRMLREETLTVVKKADLLKK
jgi:hypothetical protein